MKTLKWYQNRVKVLLKKPQPIQRTPEWFKARYSVITASEAASCLPMTEEICKIYVDTFNIKNFKYNPDKYISIYDTKEDYIIKKCKGFYGENTFKDNIFTLHGKKFENIASRLYEQKFNTKILEFGLLPHSRLKYLSASPDGITPDGVMIEIKCPYSRKIKEGELPIYYFVQIQIQLECADLDFCDFLECEIKELNSEQDFLTLKINENQDKGIILHKINSESENDKYIYPPNDIIDYILWSKNQIELYKSQNIIIKPIYYFIEKWFVIKIKREKEWFNSIKHHLKNSINLILKLQKDKELFLNFEKSVFLLKNKHSIDKFNSSVCLINDSDSDQFSFTEEFYEEDIDMYLIDDYD